MKQLREQIRKMERDISSKTRVKSPTNQVKKDSDSYNEEFNVVQSMWDDLGVTDDYREIFDSIAREVDEKFRKELFETEVSSLMRLSENLTKLNKEVLNREKSLSMLIKFEEALSRSKEVSEKVINDMKLCIRNVRIQSINIINHFNKIRELCSYEIIGGKFDLDKINKVYNFDRNYLIKMKFDLEFLKNSALELYFNISDGWDPFLQNLSEKKEGKITVDINQDMLDSIKNCQFLIIQDIIFYQLASKTNRNSTNPKDHMHVTSKSPGKIKLNYPYAKSTRLNSPPMRPTSSSNFGYYKLNLNKNNRQYNSLFFTKEAINGISQNKNKRILLETKEKESKTIDNYKTFQQNLMKPKDSHNTIERINASSDTNQLINNLKPEKKEVILDRIETAKSKKTNIDFRNISNIPVIENEYNNSLTNPDNVSPIAKTIKEEKIQNKKEEIINTPVHLAENNNDKQSHVRAEERNTEEISQNLEHSDKNINFVAEYNKDDHREQTEEEIKYDFEEEIPNKIIEKNDLERVKDQIIENDLSAHKICHSQLISENIKNKEDYIDENIKPESIVENVIEEASKKNCHDKDINLGKENELLGETEKVSNNDNHKLNDENDSAVIEQKIIYKKLHNDTDENPIVQNSNKQVANEKEIKNKVDDFVSSLLSERKNNEQDVKEDLFINEKNNEKLEKPNISTSYDFYNKSIKEFFIFYEQYYKSIPDEQKICFKPSLNSNVYIKGLNPKILTAKQGGDIVGLCFVNYENQSNHNLRIVINHISTIKTEEFEEILRMFVDKIFRELKCDEIVIDIHYQYLNGSFVMKKEIFNVLKDSLKFKWCNLENRTAEERLQKMSLKKQDLLPDYSIKYSISLTNANNIIVSELKEKVKTDTEREKNINAFLLIYSLLQLKNQEYILENEHLNNFNWEKLKNLCKDIIVSSDFENEKLESLLKSKDVPLETKGVDNHHSLLMSLNAKFLNILTNIIEVKGSNYLYNRIELNLSESLIDPETSQVFYVVSSGDESNSIIIAQLNEQFKSLIQSSKRNLCELIFEKYPKLENIKSDTKNGFIWIPCYSNHCKDLIDHPMLMSDVIIKRENHNYEVSQIEEYKNFSFLPDRLHHLAPIIKPEACDIFIDDTFLISIVNINILTELGIPSLYLQIVQPEIWTRVCEL